MRSRLLAVPLFVAALTPALSFPPPRPVPPEEVTLRTIATRSEQLASAVDRLRRKGVGDPALSDIEVFLPAVQRTVRHGEWYHKRSADWCLAALDEGLLRASQQARGEAPWWQIAGQPFVRGYRSRVDGSVQPYAVTFPRDYGRRGKRYRIDVVLHGRDDALTEVRFLHEQGERAAPKDQTWVQLDVYGRGNNGYRWAGEMDVWEALNHFLAVEQSLGRGQFPDTGKVVLRGFSMGGAGTWHIGLHKSDSFCVIGPGAGFTTTHGYVKGLPEKLPDYQEACLRIYDAVDYSENAFNVPVVAYAGEKDPQLEAARNVRARLKGLDLPTPMTLLVAPGLKHEFPPEWRKKAQALYARYADREREEYPRKVRFVTYTLKYSTCYWVEVLGLQRHYRKALVEAEANPRESKFTIKTANVRALHLTLWPGGDRREVDVAIDGQKLEGLRPYLPRGENPRLHLYLEKRGGKWASVLPERLFTARLRKPEKTHDLQGPIDDAFMGPFLCVRGTGKPWHESTGRYAEAELARFASEWSKYLRGELPVKDDVEVTAEDLATRNLVLFGDPSSNSLIEQALPGLPLGWTKERITWGGKDYDASTHMPVLIYPSPLAEGRYVVLNSGHTFHAPAFRRTNALLYPRLGDYAVLKVKGDKKDPLAAEVQTAGLFDEFWGLPKRP